MAPTTTELGGLPPEILRRIVVAGSYELLPSLMLVNKTFYGLCHDRVMYRSLILGRERPNGVDWNLSQLSIYASAETWSVWAKADFLASRMTRSVKPHDFSRWGPHLMLSNHPMCQTLELSILWDMVGLTMKRQALGLSSSRDAWRKRTAGGSEDILFLLVLCLSVRHLWIPPGWNGEIQNTFRAPRLNSPYYSEISQAFRGDDWDSSCWNDQFSYCEPDYQAIICATLGIIEFSIDLRRNLRMPQMQLQPMDLQLQHPSASDIPMSLLVRLDLPFIGKLHPRSYIKDMTHSTYLEEEEWMGYYTYKGPQTFVDPPMENIRFKVTEDSNPHVMTVSASGIDRVGNFDLSGKIFKQSGRALLSKKYQFAHWWRWSAAFTPFGMVGTWGSHGSPEHFEGWFWIWRKSWTPQG